ncbi:hypothetical protein [Nocardia tengchongensis]|uniref:hypothetical protein n=1 Tax=Nocardia tengchongensis TaxID=2055889 RepID=UPI0036911247
MPTPQRLAPEDAGPGIVTRREWGGWVIRPPRGIRRQRLALPLAYTRSLQAGDDATITWTGAKGY